jgi:hypothetical protein
VRNPRTTAFTQAEPPCKWPSSPPFTPKIRQDERPWGAGTSRLHSRDQALVAPPPAALRPPPASTIEDRRCRSAISATLHRPIHRPTPARAAGLGGQPRPKQTSSTCSHEGPVKSAVAAWPGNAAPTTVPVRLRRPSPSRIEEMAATSTSPRTIRYQGPPPPRPAPAAAAERRGSAGGDDLFLIFLKLKK